MLSRSRTALHAVGGWSARICFPDSPTVLRSVTVWDSGPTRLRPLYCRCPRFFGHPGRGLSFAPLCVARDLGWWDYDYLRWDAHNASDSTLLQLPVVGAPASSVGPELPLYRAPALHFADRSRGCLRSISSPWSRWSRIARGAEGGARADQPPGCPQHIKRADTDALMQI
jgi:hypothetical protein